MEYLGISYDMKHPPVLDPGFIPAGVWFERYQTGAKKPVAIAIERLDGHVTVRHTCIYGKESMQEADFRYLDRYVKFLLWSIGGFRIYICGCPEFATRLAQSYSPDGDRNFESVFFQRLYERPLEIVSLPLQECPQAKEAPRPIGGHLDGCRIGFDAGGSDWKVSAVVDGNCIFSQEVMWSPKLQEDPQYHFDNIMEAFHLAASKMPRVDAIGVSSAGIFIGNAPMIAALFMKVPRERWDEVKTIYDRAAAQIGNVPLAVANDGDVSALAGAMSLGVGSIMGIAMGTSQAVGYVDRDQNVLDWISELSMATVDLNEEAVPDGWSADIGAGGRYFSQDAVIRLAPKAGIELPQDDTPAEKLLVVQQLMELDDPRAQRIYETIGAYLAYTAVLYSQFYDIRHLMLLGRVTSGKGGDTILRHCNAILSDEFPALHEKLHILLPDENTRRVGQAVAAASLPSLLK